MAQFFLFNCCSLAFILPCTFLPFSANPTLSECLPHPTYISPQNVLTNLWDISFRTTRPSSLRKEKQKNRPMQIYAKRTQPYATSTAIACGLYLYLAPVPKECLQPRPPPKRRTHSPLAGCHTSRRAVARQERQLSWMSRLLRCCCRCCRCTKRPQSISPLLWPQLRWVGKLPPLRGKNTQTKKKKLSDQSNKVLPFDNIT